MTKTAQLIIDGKTIELPIVEGTQGDRALDITRLRSQTGLHHLRPRLHEHRPLQKLHHLC